MQNSLVLRRQDFKQFQGNNLLLWIRVVMMFTAIAIPYHLYFQTVKHPFLLYLLTLVAFSLGIFLYIRFINKTKVEISDLGIEYRSGLPEFLKQLDPDWKSSWENIQEVSFVKQMMKDSLITPLQIKLDSKTVKLIPSQWVIPKKIEKGNPSKSIFQTLFDKQNNYKLLVENSPLIKIFEKKGFLQKGVSLEKLESGLTDINSNPVALGMASFFFLSIFYYIGDVYFGLSEFYIDTPPYLWIVIVGITIGLVAHLILKTTELKSAEKIIMAVLVGFGAALITYPILLRVNEWTDTDELRTYSYKLGEKGVWTPENNIQLPELTFDLQISRYWKHFEIGTLKNYQLRKGGLGFYQINMKDVYEEQRIFYEDGEIPTSNE